VIYADRAGSKQWKAERERPRREVEGKGGEETEEGEARRGEEWTVDGGRTDTMCHVR